MAISTYRVDLPSQSAQDFKDICNLAVGENQAVINLSNLFRRIAGGSSYGTITCHVGAVQASGTLTVSSTGSANNETVTIANVVFTAKTSGAVGNQFNISSTPATQAANMVIAINASANLTNIVTATSVGGVVTLLAVGAGVGGNGLQLSSTLSNVALGAFAGGSVGTAYTLNLS